MTVATIYSSQDAMGNSASAGGAPDGNTGSLSSATSTAITAGVAGGKTPVWVNAVLQFDVSSLVGKYIVSASFKYWILGLQTSLSIRAYLATSAWQEVNSTTGPTFSLVDFSGLLPQGATGAYETSSDPKWKEWVQEWANALTPNYGVVLDSEVAPAGYLNFSAREETGTGQDPYLSVTYTSKPVITNLNIGGGASVPQAGNVQPAFSFSDPDGDTLAQVAIRRARLTGA